MLIQRGYLSYNAEELTATPLGYFLCMNANGVYTEELMILIEILGTAFPQGYDLSDDSEEIKSTDER